jgi:quinol-cytochrome oxidoreductase complex cytochrome b subunit
VTDPGAMSSDSEGPPATPTTALTRARVAVLAILSIQFLVLLVSGVALSAYRPAGNAAYAELFGDDVRSSIDLAYVARVAHQVAARTAIPTAVVTGVLVAVRQVPSTRQWLGVLVGTTLVLLVLAGSFTGHLLPWDQLGLWAVSVGDDMRGYVPLFDHDKIRFVLIGGAEVAPGTMIRWLLVHTLVIGTALSSLLAVAWRRSIRQPA